MTGDLRRSAVTAGLALGSAQAARGRPVPARAALGPGSWGGRNLAHTRRLTGHHGPRSR